MRVNIRSNQRYRRLRRILLAQEPLCRECDKVYGKATPATELHHILSLKDHPDLAYDPDNLEPLCGQCHKRLTRIQVSNKRGCDEQGNLL